MVPARKFLPIELVVVQATSFCNLNCKYCYLSEETRKATDRISVEKIAEYFSRILSSHYLGNQLVISWHSGEPLVLGPAYYESIIEIVSELARQHCGPEFEVLHDFQTNGTLINEEWCAFFRKYHGIATVGISCDGPEFLHDAFRLDWRGKKTSHETARGIELLAKHNIKFGLIAVVSPHTLHYPDEFFDFFYTYRDYISEFRFNLLDEFSDVDEFSYDKSHGSYYKFLTRLLDKIEALGADDELLNIKNFSYFYARLLAPQSERLKQTAEQMSRPFRALNIATNGDVSTFYAGTTVDECADIYGDGKGLVIGNLNDQSLDDIAASTKMERICSDFEVSHSRCEEACPYFELCPGGYNLVKFKRYGTFDVSETPECKVQVQIFSDALMDHLKENMLVYP